MPKSAPPVRLAFVTMISRTGALGAIAAVGLLAGCAATGTSAPTTPESAPASSSPPASAGCAASATSVPIGTSTRTVTVDGVQRGYRINVPVGYQPGKPTPLVMTFHGRGLDASLHFLLTEIAANSDANNYIAVAPEVPGGSWQVDWTAATPTSPQLGYADAVRADVEANLCVDPTKRYASGLSSGSSMVFLLACRPQRDYAAFGGVALTFYSPASDSAPPAPIIYFHGTSDPTVPYNGGDVPGVRLPSAPEAIAGWVAHNKCTAGPATQTIADVSLQQWTSCAADADVDFYTVNGGGHTWPGMPAGIAAGVEQQYGKTTSAVAATQLMWTFFSRYQLS